MRPDLKHNIISLLLKDIGSTRSKIALVQDRTSLSYQELLGELENQAAYIKSKGLKPGDRVLVFLPMSIELYTIVLALFYSGITPVFIDEWVNIKRLALCCKLVGCKGIITKKRFLLLSYIIPGIKDIPVKLSAGKRKRQSSIGPQPVSLTDTALITFTTGSTGIPKAANRTHGFLHAQFVALEPLLSQQGESILTTLPIITLLNLGAGKTTILPPKGFSSKRPTGLIFILKQKNADSIITSPSIAVALAKTQSDLSHIRHMITGGGPLMPTDAKLVAKKFDAASITVVYGSTEAEPISHLKIEVLANTSTDVILEKGLPVGKPGAIELRIIKLSGEIIAPADEESMRTFYMQTGEPGEIIVSGPHVLKDYINNPEAIARNKITVNGITWHRTGDVGRIDESGNLYFLGRINEVISWQGKTIFPLIVSILLKKEINIDNVALLLHNNQFFIIVEQQYRYKEQEIERQLEILGISGKLSFIKNVPLDPRHQTKIDYEKLKEQFTG